MSPMKNNTVCEVVEGTRANPGKVLKTFTSAQTYKCGGPNTACLRFFDSLKRKMEAGKVPTAPIFFRTV